jgi:hypothetical protein
MLETVYSLARSCSIRKRMPRILWPRPRTIHACGIENDRSPVLWRLMVRSQSRNLQLRSDQGTLENSEVFFDLSYHILGNRWSQIIVVGSHPSERTTDEDGRRFYCYASDEKRLIVHGQVGGERRFDRHRRFVENSPWSMFRETLYY